MSKKSLNEVLKQITPLPWNLPESEGPAFARNIITDNSNKLVGMTLAGFDGLVPAEINATYLTHAANVLPKLVKALRVMLELHDDTAQPTLAGLEATNLAEDALKTATNISIS